MTAKQLEEFASIEMQNSAAAAVLPEQTIILHKPTINQSFHNQSKLILSSKMKSTDEYFTFIANNAKLTVNYTANQSTLIDHPTGRETGLSISP